MNYVSNDLIEKSELRNQLINRIDVLNKVKELFLIPKLEMMPTTLVTDFYEVKDDVIKQLYARHKEEIDSDGVMRIGGREFRRQHLDTPNIEYEMIRGHRRNGHATYRIGKIQFSINNNGSYFFSPRAVLRIGMLLRDSEVAKEVRTQLLNTFECATEEQKTEAIDEEGRLLLDIIRAESDDLVAVGLRKYRDYMNRHIAKLENEKANLQTELDVANNNIATWQPQEIMKCLIASIARTIRGENKFAFAWGRLKKNLYHRHGINLEGRKVKSGKNKPYVHFIKDDEWDKVIQECYILAKEAGVNIVEAVGSLNAESLKRFDDLVVTE